MSISGMAQQRLDEIQLRLIGADHRQWSISSPLMLDTEGRRMVVKSSRKAMKKAVRSSQQAAVAAGKSKAAHEVDPEDKDNEILCDKATLTESLVLFKRSNNTTDDMLEFIAHAPEDIDDLLKEVFCLREMMAKLREQREAAVQELLTKRVEASRAEDKIKDMRGAWRTLCKEMGARPGQ